MELTGKTAFVTGGGSGIGRAIALALAKEGAKVAVGSRNLNVVKETAKLIRQAGGESVALQVDVTKKADIEKAVLATVEKFGSLDIMVNNAGVSTMNHAVKLSEEEWDFNMDTNAKGTFFGCQVAAVQMIKQSSGGKIINIGSLASKVGAPFFAHYAASKFAVLGLTQSLALELAKHRILVNAVCPGFVHTSMQEREVEREAKLLGKTQEEILQSYIDRIPLCRLEEPEDVANVVVFLASKRSNYMTGQGINVTGGCRMD